MAGDGQRVPEVAKGVSLFSRKSATPTHWPMPSPEQLQGSLREVVRRGWTASVPPYSTWLYMAELQRQIDAITGYEPTKPPARIPFDEPAARARLVKLRYEIDELMERQ